MIEKWLSVLLVLFCLTPDLSGSLEAQTREDILVQATLFRGPYVENNQLTSRYSLPVTVLVNHLQITGNQLNISGSINRTPFQFSGDIKGDKIIEAADITNHFHLLSIYVVNREVELYVKAENNDYIRIRLTSDQSRSPLYYNRYWYNQFIHTKAKNVTSSQIVTKSYNTHYDEVYERTFSIFGDQWTERLTLTHYYNWPSSTDGNGRYWFVTAEVTENKTTIDYYDPEKKDMTVEGSSLGVAGAQVAFGTDSGEYMKHAVADFSGTRYSGGSSIKLEYGLSIPHSPIGVKFDWPEAKYIDDGYDHRFSFNYKGEKKTQGYVLNWDPYKYHLKKTGDFFEVASWIMTDESYAEEDRKRLKTEWKYEIVSDGLNRGTPVPSYNESGGFSNTLYYDLIFND